VKFHESDIPGVFLIEAEPHSDERGFFARLYSPEEFADAGIVFTPAQVNLSRNTLRHTLRGLHYQDPPYSEAKLVHVTCGSAYDVVVDLRRDNATFGKWTAFSLDATTARAIFVPPGCAHGFLTLEPNTDVLYHMAPMHIPGQARGYRWNDPVLNIRWPAEPKFLSTLDAAWPNFSFGR
jgi:dTDP-4-dehydrorhamnose 3,5-epimerase